MTRFDCNAKISTFVAKKCSVWLLSTKFRSKRLAENDVKTDVKMLKRRPDVKKTFDTESKQHFLSQVSDTEIPIPSARIVFLS